MAHRQPAIWTVGHSNRAQDDFLELLRAAGIEHLADVRRYPGSRRWPQYNRQDMQQWLDDAGIGYTHLPGLGGRRGTPAPDSPNTGWRVDGFAAYADYLNTVNFEHGLNALTTIAAAVPTAIMCAEAVPWRCHRRIIADALIVRGWTVFDVLAADRIQPHRLPSFARVDNGELTYPPQPEPPGHGLFDQAT